MAPKRAALADANKRLDGANKKLTGIRAKVKELKDRVASLEDSLMKVRTRLCVAHLESSITPQTPMGALVVQVPVSSTLSVHTERWVCEMGCANMLCLL